ncbi:MAG: hypothetical protein ABI625_10275 [bacterium]
MSCKPAEAWESNASQRSLSPPDAEEWRFVVRAFAAAVDEASSDAMAVLRRATVEVAAKVRRHGLPPERAVIALKSVLAGRGGCGWSPSLGADPEAHKATLVYAELFAWFITTYYSE